MAKTFKPRVVAHFASRWTEKLPAHKPGGLYKTFHEFGGSPL
jgi:hypothetical protein